MKDSISIETIEYTSFLDELSLEYRVHDAWIYYGNPILNDTWVLYLSSRPKIFHIYLRDLLKIITRYRLPFRLIKDQKRAFELNNGILGIEEVGKSVSIFPESHKDLIAFLEEITPIANKLEGPSVNNAIKIKTNIYALLAHRENVKVENQSQEILEFVIPSKNKIPFKLAKDSISYDQDAKAIGNGYFLTTLIRRTPKGNIYKGYYFNWLKIKPVFVKQGKRFTAEDKYGRDIKDRLHWQKRISDSLSNCIPTPKVLDYFEYKNDTYLIFELLTGLPLRNKIKNVLTNESWFEIAVNIRNEILKVYLNILDIVDLYHKNGYVHRDLTDDNFIIAKNGTVYLVDNELTYSLSSLFPNPAFQIGTPGYTSPEQYANEQPQITDDIFSLGALLFYMVSSVFPGDHEKEGRVEITDVLETLFVENQIKELIKQCLSEPIRRPSLSFIRSCVKSLITY